MCSFSSRYFYLGTRYKPRPTQGTLSGSVQRRPYPRVRVGIRCGWRASRANHIVYFHPGPTPRYVGTRAGWRASRANLLVFLHLSPKVVDTSKCRPLSAPLDSRFRGSDMAAHHCHSRDRWNPAAGWRGTSPSRGFWIGSRMTSPPPTCHPSASWGPGLRRSSPLDSRSSLE